MWLEFGMWNVGFGIWNFECRISNVGFRMLNLVVFRYCEKRLMIEVRLFCSILICLATFAGDL